MCHSLLPARYMRWKEVEYLHALNSEWYQEHMWLLSSFHRRHALHRPLRLLWNSAMVATFAAFRWDVAVQADIMLVLILLLALAVTFVRTYRCDTSPSSCQPRMLAPK